MSVHDPTSCSLAVLAVCPTTPSSGGQKRLGRASFHNSTRMGQPIILQNLWSNFGPWPRRHENADEIEAFTGSPEDRVIAKTEHSGTKLPESERRVPKFLPKCSPPVRRTRGGAA